MMYSSAEKLMAVRDYCRVGSVEGRIGTIFFAAAGRGQESSTTAGWMDRLWKEHRLIPSWRACR